MRTTVVSRGVQLSDGSITRAVILRTVGFVELVWDSGLANLGMVPDAGRLLIDQAATQQLLGRPAGFTPAEYLADYPVGSLIVNSPGHFGWQNGCGLVSEAQTVRMVSDPLPMATSWLGQNSDGNWRVSEGPSGLFAGWSGPLIVHAGQVVPLADYIGDVRLLADARNIFVFNEGEVPGDFFQLIRPLLPASLEDLQMMLEGYDVSVSRLAALDDEQFQRLSEIIFQHHQDHLGLTRNGDLQTLTVLGQRPRMRMPLTGVGYDDHNELIAVAVDGRQPNTAGCTIEELAEILASEGAVSATLGGGGGDVGIAVKQEEGVVFHNTPSNKDDQGQFGAPRRVPNALIIPAN